MKQMYEERLKLLRNTSFENSQRQFHPGCPNSERLLSSEYRGFFEVDDSGGHALRGHKWKFEGEEKQTATRSTGTVHTSTNARFTSVAI